MHINDLPPECLLKIFQVMFNLKDLVHCHRVCVKWSELVAYRMSKVEYLTDDKKFDCPPHAVEFSGKLRLEPFDLAKLLNNVKIVNIYHPGASDLAFRKIVKNVNTIKAIIHEDKPRTRPFIPFYCKNLEMIACDSMKYYLRETGYAKSTKISQIYTSSFNNKERGESPIHYYFPNLVRFHIDAISGRHDENWFRQCFLENLEILEYSVINRNYRPQLRVANLGYYIGFRLIDFCPKLKSAFFNSDCFAECHTPRLKNELLEDLVIEHQVSEAAFGWDRLYQIIEKYPNVKHLAIRGSKTITDDDLVKFVEQMPKLVLLDVRGCPTITGRSVSSINEHCRINGRKKISLYYKSDNQIYLDWPELSTKTEKVVHEFNFMKHCFLKKFDKLPYFMFPAEETSAS